MTAINYTTVQKTTALARVSTTTDDRFLNPNELGARVRVSEIDYAASGAQTLVVIGRFEKPCKITELFFVSNDGFTCDIGVTPISAPDDAVNQIANDLVVVAGTAARPAGAFNYEITEPSLVVLKVGTGDIANAATLKGSIQFVEGS
jgi:hypothetical protein